MRQCDTDRRSLYAVDDVSGGSSVSDALYRIQDEPVMSLGRQLVVRSRCTTLYRLIRQPQQLRQLSACDQHTYIRINRKASSCKCKCSWLPPFCKRNLLLFIQPRWQPRTYFYNHYNVFLTRSHLSPNLAFTIFASFAVSVHTSIPKQLPPSPLPLFSQSLTTATLFITTCPSLRSPGSNRSRTLSHVLLSKLPNPVTSLPSSGHYTGYR